MLTHKEYLKKFNERWQGEYELIGTYIKSDVSILIRHNICGKTFEKPASEALRYGCKECAREILQNNLLDGGKYKTQEQFTRELEAKFGDEYTVSGAYTHYKRKVKLHHTICGHDFYLRPTDILYDNRECTYCGQSQGAKDVEDYLISKGITYLKEYSFNDCAYEKKLYFDFALFDNKTLQCLIEYDGRQHYKDIELFGGKTRLEYTKKLDDIKNNYCKVKGIQLIRVPYFIDNVRLFLDNALMKVKGVV